MFKLPADRCLDSMAFSKLLGDEFKGQHLVSIHRIDHKVAQHLALVKA